MAKFLGGLDLAIAKTSLQQPMTELNSSDNKCSFLFERGSKLSFRALTTILSTLSTRIKALVEDINNLRQFLPLKFWASLAVGG